MAHTLNALQTLANMGLDSLLSSNFQGGCAQTESALVNLLRDHSYLKHSCHCWAHYIRSFEELDKVRSDSVHRDRKRLCYVEPMKEAIKLDRTRLHKLGVVNTTSSPSRPLVSPIHAEVINESEGSLLEERERLILKGQTSIKQTQVQMASLASLQIEY